MMISPTTSCSPMPADDWRRMTSRPSRLVEFFTRRAAIAQEREIAELLLELSGNSARHYLIFPGQDAKEKQRREDERRTEEYARAITERQNRLLVQIEERQREVEQRRQEIENNAIRLHDGRRAYIDGDRYRDGEGRALTGGDETEAARQHQYQPHASTWQQKQENERQAEELRQMKEIVVESQKQEPSEQAEHHLAALENEFAPKTQERAAQTLDYGTSDYMAALGDEYTTVPAFTKAADAKASAHPSETETDSAQTKNAPRPQGQGMKLNA